MKTLLVHLIVLAAGLAHAQRPAYRHVQVVVDGDVARTTFTEVIVNDLPHPVEASFGFPLPADAVVTGFAEWRDGVKIEAQTRDRDAARAEYDRAVEAGEAAAHGETEASDRFRLTLSPLAPRDTRRVELRYQQTLSALGGERTFVFPAGGDASPARVLDVEVVLNADRPITAVEVPNHLDAHVANPSESNKILRLSRVGEGLGHDLVVRYRQQAEPLDLAARAVRPHPGQPGFVEARFAFTADPLPGLQSPRSVVVVLDTSLSMAGTALESARAAALAVLDHLDPQDVVEVVAFADGVESAFNGLAPADARTRAVARDFIDGRVPGGRSDLEAALRLAGKRLAGRPDGVLVLLTDGQPTTRADGDAFGLDLDTAAFADARVVVGHFNYPRRTDALAAIFPNVSAVFVPDGPAAEGEIDRVARLAVAPVIEDLHFEIGGSGVYQVHGALPDRLAVGEHVRLLARLEGDAWVTVTGTLHGEAVELRQPVFPKSGDDLGLPTEWARLRVADLDAEYRALDDAPARELVAEEIRALGTTHRLATRFTGLVLSDRLDPDTIKPGDPEIRVHAPATASGVFAVLPWGEVIHCTWDDAEGLWLGRFLVPRATPDGLYRARIFVEDQADATYRGALFFRVDSTLPALRARAGRWATARGGG
jgi:Ca-activated chloride channel family protein